MSTPHDDDPVEPDDCDDGTGLCTGCAQPVGERHALGCDR